MLIIEKLNLKEKMSDGEESIAAFILTLGKELHKYSTRNIAEATLTSPATVIRLCKKLDFKGFDDFKEQFLKEMNYLDQQYGKVDANFPFNRNDTMMKTAHKISHLYEDTVTDTMTLLHHDDLQKALRLLKNSNSIHIFSTGTALNLAESFNCMRLAVFQKEISPLLFPTRVKRSIQLKLLKLVKIIRFRLLQSLHLVKILLLS